MKYALAFSAVCLVVVLTHQQCAVYENSGIKGLSKLQDQSNICGNILSPNDLGTLTDLRVVLASSDETIESEEVDVCTIKFDNESVAICKVGVVFRQSILDKEDEEKTATQTIGDHEYIYYTKELLDETEVYMYMSEDETEELLEEESSGIVCSGIVETEEVQDSIVFEIAVTILENIWHHTRSLDNEKDTED